MMDLIALLLKLAGVAFVLVAAIGVIRLPDPFLRMHAATKAGTLGAGLALMGVALAFGDLATAVIAMLTVVFLLATLPIAAHLLGRAAYVSGADLWQGTVRDDLKGVLQRQPLHGLVGPEGLRDLPAPGAAPRPVTGSPARHPAVADLSLPDPGEAVRRRPLEKVSVAVIGPDPAPLLRSAARLARRTGAELMGLALLDARLFQDAAALAGADDLRETCRGRLAAAIAAAEMEAAALGLRLSVRFEEGNIPDLLRQSGGGDGIIALPGKGWFDHGVTVPSGCYSWAPDSLLHLPGTGIGPMMLGEGCEPGSGRVVIIDDGGADIARLTAWAVSRGLCDGAEMLFVPRPGGPAPADDRRRWFTTMASLAGLRHGWSEAGGGADGCLLDLDRHRCDLVVMTAPPHPRRTDWFGHFWQDRIMKGWRGQVLLP